ncbi:MAG: ABC transporter permease [Candidatus Promineifilaceae bacterium]|nr:ABC transporter permease [Candidatus Promineifilaceae bacterium]
MTDYTEKATATDSLAGPPAAPARIWTLLRKELRQGATSFFFVYSLVVPVVLTLLVALVFGDLFAATPRLGIHDAAAADSAVTRSLLAHESLDVARYDDEAALRAAVGRGAVEVGVALPADFDAAVQGGGDVNLTVYRWGEAGVRSLLLLESAVASAAVDALGVELPVQVDARQLGSADSAGWSQRLLPLILLMAIMLGGLMIPASSLIEEKQKRTLVALTTTPASLWDVYLAKTLAGFLVSAFMGVAILLLNDALGGQPLLLIAVVALGALMSSAIGILVGSLVDNIDAFMGALKAFGILLFAPGILELFPQAPAWIGRLFPTYYLLNPLLAVSQRGAALADVAGELAVLAAIVGALLLALALVVDRQRERVALA